MKRAIRLFENLSVTWKFMFTYLTVLSIFLTIAGIYLYNQSSGSAIEQAETVMRQNLQQTKESIREQTKVMENVSQIIAFDNKLQTFLSDDFTEDIIDIENYQFTIRPFVENIMRQNRNIHAIHVFMTNPTIPEIYDSFYNERKIADQDWFQKAVSREQPYDWRPLHAPLIHTSTTSLAQEDDRVFSLYRKIYSIAYSDRVGLLEMEVKESVLFSVLRDPVITKFGDVFVVDSSNRVVSNNIPSRFMKRATIPGVDDPAESVNRVERVNGEKSIVLSIPINELNCRIVGIFPVKHFNGKVRSAMFTIILVLSASLLLLGLIIYLVTRALLRRIKILVKAMKQVRMGSLDVSVPVKSNDEFSQLTMSFNHMTSRIHELVETVYKMQIMEKDAELKALEAQVNPHFLYNTLATIAWVARRDGSQDTVHLSTTLAKLYRLVLNKGGTTIPVREEIEMVKAYMHIQKFRFENAFDVTYDIDEELLSCRVIKNMLQPIVENALNHGIEPKRCHGTIQIKGSMEGNFLTLRIIDDGVGINSDTLEAIMTGRVSHTSGSGYALYNIRERLKSYYGNDHLFEIYSKPGIGTVITITIRKEL